MSDLSMALHELTVHICNFKDRRGYAPSPEETADALGKKLDTVKRSYSKLCKMGYLKIYGTDYFLIKRPALPALPDPKPHINALTDRQRAVFMAIYDACKTYGYSPNLRDIARVTDCNVNSVTATIERLEALGFLRKLPRRLRNLEIVLPPSRPNAIQRSERAEYRVRTDTELIVEAGKCIVEGSREWKVAQRAITLIERGRQKESRNKKTEPHFDSIVGRTMLIALINDARREATR